MTNAWRRACAQFLGALCLILCSGGGSAQVVTTVSGNGTWTMSGDGGPATAAGHGSLSGMARDGLGNLFVVEFYDYRIRKIAPNGIITQFAGNGQPVFVSGTETQVGDGGPATAAAISPFAVAADAVGNVYFTDQQHHRVRKITPGGVISTLAGRGEYGFSGDGGQATLARLGNMRGIAVDGAGNVFISVGHAIRKIASNGIISTVAGNGQSSGFAGDGGAGTAAYLNTPAGLVVDATGTLYVADSKNGRVRRITAGGTISTVMGVGPLGDWRFEFDATRAQIGEPSDVAVDSKGYVYATSGDTWVRKVSPEGLLANAGGFRCPHDGCGTSSPPPWIEGGEAFQAFLGGTLLEIEPDDQLLVGGGSRVRRVSATPPAQAPLAVDVLKPFQKYAIDSFPEAVAVGDYDGDGRVDAVVATSRRYTAKPDDFKVLLYRQPVAGAFATPAKSTYTVETWELSPGLLMTDLNHDGRKDIVVARAHGLTVYLGNAGGVLSGQDVEAPLLEVSFKLRMATSDVDGDGHADILVAARHKDQAIAGFWIFHGIGNGGFHPAQFFHNAQTSSWWGPNEMHTGDLNGDGHDDLLVGGTNSMAGVYFHNGMAGFGPGVAVASNQAFSVGDADDDGRVDAISSRDWAVPTLHLRRQDANGRLDAPRLFPLERGAGQSLLADMNGDGRSDVLLLHGGWGLSYLERTGAGYHRPRKYFAPSGNGSQHQSAFAVAQLDGDGCRDVAVVSDVDGLVVYHGQKCVPPNARHDADADGRGELAWRAADGTVHLWPGADRSQSMRLAPGIGWDLAAMADFGGDGRADLLWRHCVNGALMRWSGVIPPARPVAVAGPDRAWRLVATADFDGDGRADLLWQHASGATERWPAGDRAGRQRGAMMPAGWSAVASGDFDGDGRDDVFWRHAPTGANLVWKAGGRAGALRITAITDRAWHVAGAGDVDNDGRADVLWRHATSGRNALWPAAQFNARRELQAMADASWTVATVTDVDGDRRADVLWRHASGIGVLWKRADPALAHPVPPTPRGWASVERSSGTCTAPGRATAPPRAFRAARGGRID